MLSITAPDVRPWLDTTTECRSMASLFDHDFDLGRVATHTSLLKRINLNILVKSLCTTREDCGYMYLLRKDAVILLFNCMQMCYSYKLYP